MAARVPVLGQDDMRETLGETVDRRHDLVALRHRQRAAGQKIVLQVDDQQNIPGAKRRSAHPAGPSYIRNNWPKPGTLSRQPARRRACHARAWLLEVTGL